MKNLLFHPHFLFSPLNKWFFYYYWHLWQIFNFWNVERFQFSSFFNELFSSFETLHQSRWWWRRSRRDENNEIEFFMNTKANASSKHLPYPTKQTGKLQKTHFLIYVCRDVTLEPTYMLFLVISDILKSWFWSVGQDNKVWWLLKIWLNIKRAWLKKSHNVLCMKKALLLHSAD